MIRLRVKEISESKKISRTKLAKIALVDYKTVKRLFDDPSVDISLSTLDKLAWALRVQPAELIEYTRTTPLIWQDEQNGEE